MATFKKKFPGRLQLIASNLSYLVSFGDDDETLLPIIAYYRGLDGFHDLMIQMGVRSEHDAAVAILWMYGLDAYRENDGEPGIDGRRPSYLGDGELHYEWSGVDDDVRIFWRDLIKSNPRYLTNWLYGYLPTLIYS